MKPDFRFEKKHPRKFIIGVDEVGRGSLVGPVVAGAVCLFSKNREEEWMSKGIDDSKRLSAKKRETLSETILSEAVWGLGESDVSTINSIGIVAATGLAMRSAVKQLMEKVGLGDFFILVDGMPVAIFGEEGWQYEAVIKGDQKSISVAAASIMAKVYRDNLMAKIATEFPWYGWERNKGYGTQTHLEVIKKRGPTVFHRKDFLRKGDS
jgi:ribonuclease HII